MKIIINQDKCVASGQCVLVAADVFGQRDEDGISMLLNDNPSAERLAEVELAADACPALAITVEK